MRKKITYQFLLEMAQSYGVADNALFLAASRQYIEQKKVMDMITGSLDDDELLVTKEYVKGRENQYSNPLIKELPKHIDSMNKTLQIMLQIIVKLGHEPHTPSKLDEFLQD